MTSLTKGGNVGLTDAGLSGTVLTISLRWQPAGGVDADCSALLLAEATGKVRSDADFVFYNQPNGSGITHTGKQSTAGGSVDSLRLDTAALPPEIDRVVVAASADGGTFGQLSGLNVTVADQAGATISYDITDATTQTALVFVEVYRRGGVWKAKAVGQGYDSGLGGLATDFGVSVDEPTAAPSPAPSSAPAVSLEKRRMISLEKTLQDKPALLSLVKTAGISLEKKGLGEHTAKVQVVLDISASMNGLYRRGAVQRLVERVLALGLRFDDDGEVEVITLGKGSQVADSMTVSNYVGYTDLLLAHHPLEGATYYAKAMASVRELNTGSSSDRTQPLKAAVPTYVLFVTDGEPNDRKEAEQQIRAAAYEPIFWQFIGIGRGFAFLEKLDDLAGRYVDNADFFSVSEDELLGKKQISDDVLFGRLMQEYPAWIPQAKAKGLLS